VHPNRPAPVIVTWDEDMGWCAGLHHDPSRSSRRYLHPHLLPSPDAVAEFVVGLAPGPPPRLQPSHRPPRHRTFHGYACSDDHPSDPPVRARLQLRAS
jgi:hypothetical protein